jgi:hypothetical protein
VHARREACHHSPCICRDGWIDLNKNGRKDIYEDPSRTEDKRLDDLPAQPVEGWRRQYRRTT